MAENQLGGKELYEQRKAEKVRERTGQNTAPSSAGSRRWWLWPLVVVLFVGTAFGLYLLATKAPPGGTAGAATLADPVRETDWTSGPPAGEAPVSLVEYSDLQCPACAFYAPRVKQLQEEFPETLAVTYRHFPLTVIHQNARPAAEVAEAAGRQGKFWEAIELIFSKQTIWAEQLTARETLFDLMKPLGLNLEQLKRDAASAAVKEKIDWDYESGVRSRVEGTPTFFLNGRQISNPKTYDEFKQLITAAPAR